MHDGERLVLRPGELLVIRVAPNISRERLAQFTEELSADERLRGNVLVVAAEQLAIVPKGEATARA